MMLTIIRQQTAPIQTIRLESPMMVTLIRPRREPIRVEPMPDSDTSAPPDEPEIDPARLLEDGA